MKKTKAKPKTKVLNNTECYLELQTTVLAYKRWRSSCMLGEQQLTPGEMILFNVLYVYYPELREKGLRLYSFHENHFEFSQGRGYDIYQVKSKARQMVSLGDRLIRRR